jgi:hypothetical protein
MLGNAPVHFLRFAAVLALPFNFRLLMAGSTGVLTVERHFSAQTGVYDTLTLVNREGAVLCRSPLPYAESSIYEEHPFSAFEDLHGNYVIGTKRHPIREPIEVVSLDATGTPIWHQLIGEVTDSYNIPNALISRYPAAQMRHYV